jgi:hypothetical protein
MIPHEQNALVRFFGTEPRAARRSRKDTKTVECLAIMRRLALI